MLASWLAAKLASPLLPVKRGQTHRGVEAASDAALLLCPGLCVTGLLIPNVLAACPTQLACITAIHGTWVWLHAENM